MDFLYFYSRHQISLMRAHVAIGLEARSAHLRLADGYARVIGEERARRVASA